MRQGLADGRVLAALRDGGFAALVCDAEARERLCRQWTGDREGVAVLDADGAVYAARRGALTPAGLAAFLRACVRAREPLAAARAAAAGPAAGPDERLALGAIYLELGCRAAAEPLLLDAAMAGAAGARHLLARLFVAAADVQAARRWLQHAPRTPDALVTEGLVLRQERRFEAAAAVLERALATDQLGRDRQLALLCLGLVQRELGQHERAAVLLAALVREGTGSTFEAEAQQALERWRGAGRGP